MAVRRARHRFLIVCRLMRLGTCQAKGSGLGPPWPVVQGSRPTTPNGQDVRDTLDGYVNPGKTLVPWLAQTIGEPAAKMP